MGRRVRNVSFVELGERRRHPIEVADPNRHDDALCPEGFAIFEP